LNFIKAESLGGWELFGIYEDADFSTAFLDRPEFQRMLKDIRRGLIDVALFIRLTD